MRKCIRPFVGPDDVVQMNRDPSHTGIGRVSTRSSSNRQSIEWGLQLTSTSSPQAVDNESTCECSIFDCIYCGHALNIIRHSILIDQGLEFMRPLPPAARIDTLALLFPPGRQPQRIQVLTHRETHKGCKRNVEKYGSPCLE